MLARCLTHPRLIVLLAAAGWRFRRRGWYRRPPFLPVPSAKYMRWRMHTAFGEQDAEPTAAELQAFLEWSTRMRRS